MSDFATAFRTVREDVLGLTQEDFGSSIGASRQHVSRVERGLAEYSFGQLLALEQLTGMSISECLGLFDNAAPPTWLAEYVAMPRQQRRLLDGFIQQGIRLLNAK